MKTRLDGFEHWALTDHLDYIVPKAPKGDPTKHTPGPWRVVIENKETHAFEDRAHIVVADGGVFGDTEVTRLGPERAEREANARLIAAAPDLLEVSRRYLDASHLESIKDQIDSMRETDDLARAAIAKAEGSENEY